MQWYDLERFFKDAASINFSWGQQLLLYSAAANIVATRKKWSGQRSQTLLELVKSCREQQATDVRDKMYALHGLASDTDDVIVDYGIKSEQLVMATLRHTCASLDQDAVQLEKQALQIGRLLKNILKAACDDQALESVIAAEKKRMQMEGKMRKSEIARITAHEAGTRLMTTAHEQHLRAPSQGEDRGYCYFAFLQCLFRSLEPLKSFEHCIDHFLLDEPPQSMECTLYDLTHIDASDVDSTLLAKPYTQSTSSDHDVNGSGWTVWNNFLQHVQQDHGSLCFPHEEKYLWKLVNQLKAGGLIDEDEAVLLTVHGVLSQLPARYISAAAEDE
jgi:hypothetical protein